MQTTARATQRVLNQIITVYQSVLEFSLEKVWLEVIVKHNKADPDDMLDLINSKLIEVCDEYLKEHKIGLDKYQLSMVVMNLYTQTISSIDEPFKVIAKEAKQLVQDYLEKNKSKRETLERIQKENDSLDKEIAAREAELRKQKGAVAKLGSDSNEVSNFVTKPEMPSQISEAGPMGGNAPLSEPKKKKIKTTDDLAISNFKLPI